MISFHGVSKLKTYRPLEKATLDIEANGSVSVMDGAGREYFSADAAAGKKLDFKVGGALGIHTVKFMDVSLKEAGSLEFRVCSETDINDEGGQFNELLAMLHFTLRSFKDHRACIYNGKVYRYFVWWLRDHVHTLKGMKYFYADLKTGVELYRDSQREDGMVFDLIRTRQPAWGEYDERFGYGDFVKVIEDGRYHFLRIPVENDVEYLFIEGIYYTWKATGDDGWMEEMLDSAIKAFDYSMTSPYRWSEKFKLLKRAYTIDTWDFQDDVNAHIAGDDIMRVYHDKSHFGVMHGDNTGFSIGCQYLAEMLEHADRKEEAQKYVKLGREIKERVDNLAWNGSFYTHHIPEDESTTRDLGVDQSKQISLSNAYALNRGLTHEQCVGIINEYLKIKSNLPYGSQGEWYTIYPPYEWGFEEACIKWEYMNGGVTPIVAGELAHGAFNNGFEEYGVDILNRVHEIAAENGGHLDCCLKGGQPEPVQAVFSPIDINAVANAAESIAGWNGSKPEEYNEIPAGMVTLRGVPFLIPDPSKNGGKRCIGLMDKRFVSEDKPGGALQKKSGKDILINLKDRNDAANQISADVFKKAKTIYLLHTMTGNGMAGDITIEYADGKSISRYINEKQEILNWWLPEEPNYRINRKGDLVLGWEGKNEICGRAAVCVYGMANPRPDAEISRITFNASKNGNYWAVLGITLSDSNVKLKEVKTSYGIPDNWGAAAVVYALIEGLAGVVDAKTAYSKVILSPRWAAAGINSCSAAVNYPASGGYIAYNYKYTPEKGLIEYFVTGSGRNIDFHLLMPKDSGRITQVLVNGAEISYKISTIENSQYVDFSLEMKGVAEIVLRF